MTSSLSWKPRDWEEIALLYQRLEDTTNSPVVTKNRAIAIAELEGPEGGLALLDGLDLDDYRYYHSATRFSEGRVRFAAGLIPIG